MPLDNLLENLYGQVFAKVVFLVRVCLSYRILHNITHVRNIKTNNFLLKTTIIFKPFFS